GSLVASAAALVLVFARYDAPSPRLGIVGAVAAALVLAGAWALACRVAPPLAGPAKAPTGDTESVPAALPAPFRDPGRTAGAVLLALTPVTLARLAGGTEPTALEGVGMLLVLIVTLKVVGPLRKATSQKDERRRLKVLIEDAKAGEVYGLRVRAGRPTYVRYSERGDKPGEVSVSHFTTYAFQPLQGGEDIPLGTARSELARAGVLLGGEEGWLILPKRWKLIEGALPVGFVADHGGVALLGLTTPGSLPAGATLHPTT
ncbi:hypothetical protein ACL02U_32895, partial [Streptomyces sp. MS06]|uniref:hypothetical protein n=1 Tax=Streptomyces sp. MS06 TaxID=3385974 RepID=UPI0039A11308